MPSGHLVSRILAALLAAGLVAPVSAQDADARLTAKLPFPPWQDGANNPALDKGLEFTVPEVDNLADFHGNLNDPKLVLYYRGNSFFSMASVVQAFEGCDPPYRGRVYLETLPPGLLAKQMANGGTITVGNMT